MTDAQSSRLLIVDDDPELAGHPVLADELDLLFSDRDEAFLSRG